MPSDMNFYIEKRKEKGLSREQACELLDMTTGRLERAEKCPEKYLQPDDVLKMEEVYGDHEICNHYCAETCPIGQKYVPRVEVKSIERITIETLASLNRLEKDRERFLEIVEDGRLTKDELNDFQHIKDNLNKIAMAASTLELWYEKAQNALSPD